MLIIPVLRDLKQEDCHKFKTGLGYLARFCHTKMEKKKISRPIIPSLLILRKMQGSLYYCKVLYWFHLLGEWLQNVSRATAYIGKQGHWCSPHLHSWYGLQANAPHFHLAPTPSYAPTTPQQTGITESLATKHALWAAHRSCDVCNLSLPLKCVRTVPHWLVFFFSTSLHKQIAQCQSE